MMGTERLSSRLQHGGVKASLSIPGPFLQLGQASGLWLCCLSTPRAAAPSPRQRGASPPLTGSFCGTHVSSIRAVSGKTLPAAFDLQATWLDAPSTSWDAAASVLQCCCFCWGLCWLPGPVCSQSTPGAAGAHGAAPALEPPHPCPHRAFPLCSLGTFPGCIPPCVVPVSHLEGEDLSHQGHAQFFVQGWHLPRSHGPSPPQSLKQGLELHLCLASLAMGGNSQFPRELLSPGQPRSPNIYISHYCLHMRLFSGGVSSFPLLPQCSPCSISSGAAIPNALLRSHYYLINLQGKAKLSSGSNPSHRAWQPSGRRDSPRKRNLRVVGRGQGRTYFSA